MQVKINDDAIADIERLDGVIQERVLGIVERLGRWPHVSGVKALTGPWRGFSRIRTADWHVIFRVATDRVIVVRVAHRREVYE